MAKSKTKFLIFLLFIIFVLTIYTDPVTALNGTDQFCAPVGGSVTLTAFTNITGNPEPQSSWVLTGGTARGDTTSRQLTITNLTPADSGNYTNTLTNTLNGNDNRSINSTVELQVQSEFTSLQCMYNYNNCALYFSPTICSKSTYC